MRACPECDADVPDDVPVCTECGTDLDPGGHLAQLSASGGDESEIGRQNGDPPSASLSDPEDGNRGSGPDTDPVAGTDTDPDAGSTGEHGAGFGPDGRPRPGLGADYDQEEEREWFEQRYGIDIGDRTVDEFLAHLGKQDYSLTPWFWLVVASEVAGVALFAATVIGDVSAGVGRPVLFTAASVLLAVGVFVDTRVVGQFRRWAKIRWTYILMAAVPLVGHIAGFLYLVLRRFLHEQTVKHRRRLLDAGFDLDVRGD